MKERYPFVFPFIFSLSLGLAPFTPEPHLVGKFRWILGGGTGMEVMDYFDLILHLTPWVWLLFSLLKWSGIFKIKT